MIDPTDVTNFNRSSDELEEFWLFSICVAGKQADRMAAALQYILDNCAPALIRSPLTRIDWAYRDGTLRDVLKASRVGQYTRIFSAMEDMVKLGSELDLSTWLPEQLQERIRGVGPKTSRFFVLHSRKGAEYAALDTHILKYLRDEGYSAPKTTPTGKKYLELEKTFLIEAKRRNISPAEFDLQLWMAYSGREQIT